ANFLLMDEPTNHLDIPSQEILQDVLAGFDGTILLVSHDRYLIDALATQIWDLQPGGMTVFEGTYQEYLAARQAARERSETRADARRETGRVEAARAEPPPRKPAGSSLSTYERTRRLARVEQQINALEVRLVDLSGELGDASAAGAVDRVRELGEAYAAVEAELNTALEEWERLMA
ncbi:MAG: ABC transporter ATP-binding protein, partial [Chloroflexota bacterium]